MTVDEALRFFAKPACASATRSQRSARSASAMSSSARASTTLSGGEAQRVKLATELARRRHRARRLYILDEPTTGLHMYDVQKLLDVLQKLVGRRATPCSSSSTTSTSSNAPDHLIDLGPEGGDGGGTIVATGTPAGHCRLPGVVHGAVFEEDAVRRHAPIASAGERHAAPVREAAKGLRIRCNALFPLPHHSDVSFRGAKRRGMFEDPAG